MKRSKIRRLGLIALGIMMSLLLAACGGQGPAPQTITVRLLDPAGDFVAAYYRVDGGAWQALTFSQSQASFNATQAYEVAARCEPGELWFYRARVQTRSLDLECSSAPTNSVSVQLELALPAQVGNVTIQDGDLVYAGFISPGVVTSLEATVWLDLPEGPQQLAITVLRNTGNGFIPLIGKLEPLTVNANQQLYQIGDSGYVALTPRTVTNTPPSGFSVQQGFSFYYRDGMRNLGLVGQGESYGAFPVQDGVYLGFVNAANAGFDQVMTVVGDTRGLDWTVSWPQPWGASQLSYASREFTLGYPEARWYVLSIFGGVVDAITQDPLSVTMVIEADGVPTSYAIPQLENELTFGLAPGNVFVNATAIVRGDFAGFALINTSDFEPSEARLRNFDLAIANLFAQQVTFP